MHSKTEIFPDGWQLYVLCAEVVFVVHPDPLLDVVLRGASVAAAVVHQHRRRCRRLGTPVTIEVILLVSSLKVEFNVCPLATISFVQSSLSTGYISER